MLLRKVRYYKFLTGRLMVAQSGTGKTATFSISILQTINTTQRETQALVLSPTRELATQIQSVILALGEYLNVRFHFYLSLTSRSNVMRVSGAQMSGKISVSWTMDSTSCRA